MKKFTRNGSVGVLVTRNYGYGWSTFNDKYREELLFHPVLVAMVESGLAHEIDSAFLEKLGVTGVCAMGASALEIMWIPVGTSFIVECLDGWETIVYILDDMYTA